MAKSFLPDGEHFLSRPGWRDSELRVGSLTSTDSVRLGAFESQGAYAAGHLFFVRGGNLMVQAFDKDTLQLQGAPLHLGTQIGVTPFYQFGTFSVSESGRLVYRPTARTPSQLTWVDRHGRPLGTIGDPAVINALALSPDDQRVAVSLVSQIGGGSPEVDIR